MELFLWFGLIAGIVVIAAVGIAAYFIYNLAQPTVTRKAKVITKRISMPSAGPRQVYHRSFEFEDGQRAEYAVGVDKYGLIAEGDWGELVTKGELFWDFRREIR